MATYTVKPSQNIFDVALHLYGSIEGLFDLLISNEGLNMTTDLTAGMELEYHTDFVINSSIVNQMEEQGLIPANKERHVYFKRPDEQLIFVVGIDPSLLKSGFVVSGDGTMLIDWGDNSEMESVTLTHTNQTVEHYFDNEVEERRIKVYGDFSLLYFDTTNLNGDMLLTYPLTVDEYVSNANGFTLNGLFLFEGTYKVDLRQCTISSLLPLGDMNLQELDLRKVKFTDVSVLDEYLQYIVANYGTRRNCTVYLDAEPSEVGYEAIDTILNEEAWNAAGEWQFIINGTKYTNKFTYTLSFKTK